MRLNKEQQKSIGDLYKSGKTQTEISKLLKISQGSVSYWLKTDEERKTRSKKEYDKFKSKSKEEKSKIYKQRLPYLRNYNKVRYNSDKDFRLKRLKLVSNYYKRKHELKQPIGEGK